MAGMLLTRILVMMEHSNNGSIIILLLITIIKSIWREILLHILSKPAVFTMIAATVTTTIFLLLQKGTNSFMRVKIIDHQDLSVAEKQINEFLKKVEVKELVDTKFGARFKNDTEGHTFVILYEENMGAGVEDPQIYE